MAPPPLWCAFAFSASRFEVAIDWVVFFPHPKVVPILLLPLNQEYQLLGLLFNLLVPNNVLWNPRV